MNKLLVVTGGTKGIGKAIISKFLLHGFDIATCSRKEGDLMTLKNELAGKGKIHALQADVSDDRQASQFVAFVNDLKQPADVLVNNAGYFVPGEIASEPDGVLEDMMKANLYSAYRVTRGLLPGMVSNQSGHVINMCSVASLKAYANGGSYAITKAALLGFSRCLREEVKNHGIRVTAVMPGATRTASWDGVDLPEERFMKPEDVAEMIYACYAISPRSVVEELIIRPQLGDI